MAVDWQNLLKQVAPWLAAAASGNVPALIGMSANAIGSAIGTSIKPTTDAIGIALSGATPDQMLAIKNADNDFAVKMQALGFQDIEALAKIAADDRASARQMQIATKSIMPSLVTVLVLVFAAIGEGALLLGFEPHVAPELVGRILGTLDTAVIMALSYWLGTTASSGKKDDIIAQQVS